jgi:polysaccharide biosynthesis protein PslH
MNWLPNLEGADWFIDKVLPMLQVKMPFISVSIAGREIPDRMMHLQKPNLHILGEVDNARDFLLNHTALIAPLFSGSGIRVKIIEAMALGIPVISTTIGAEGINCIHGKDILIANTPEEFMDCIMKLFSNPGLCRIIAQNANQLIANEHNASILMTRLEKFYETLLN